ncbi:hypothetical protein CSA17_00400 [bacterium DOLJORAL78_65_58]|nr:MAG: hypothetical protein CSB20_04990 [bacterium DOLZORAL124_64_63]PIE76780.1 MAG: hypothetical protein CSA17_00400 [bacterium DOLJORAL78_65_58]
MSLRHTRGGLLVSGLTLALLLPLLLAARPSPAQDARPVPRASQVTPHSLTDLRRRLVELDRLLTLRSVGRAEKLLEDLSLHSPLAGELIPRRIRLAQLREDHRQAVDLARQALRDDPENSGLWRSLTAGLLAVDEPDSARMAVERFIGTSINPRSSGMVAVELFQGADRPGLAVALIDSLRASLGDEHFLARQKAAELLALDREQEAADEAVADLRYNPFNLALVRTELLEDGSMDGHLEKFLERLDARSRDPQRRVVEILLAANLLLVDGQAEPAVTRVQPLLKARGSTRTCLQNATTLVRELPLLAEDEARRAEAAATADYLLAVLGRITDEQNDDPNLRKRAADHLAAVCETALEHRILGADPAAAADRFGDLLVQVARANPQSEHLYSSQIKLAVYVRDQMGRPRAAARRLESLLLDLDMPLPGVALVRLTLGECYLAAGDTSRGRIVLTRLGREPRFREAGGHAHYHLARLDLAQGHLATAQDRFAVVALDNPAAPYANDALELGLAIAEEMDNPSGGPDFMLLYSQAVYYDLVAQPQKRIEALENFIAAGLERLDMAEPQHLLERARWDLAQAHVAAGRPADAVAVCRDIVRDHPDGRFPAEALMLQGRLLRGLGHEARARSALEQLLVQYPDFLFVDDARDILRSLP